MTPLLHIPSLLRLARNSISDPRSSARTMIALNLPRNVLWLFFFLQFVLSSIVKVVLFSLMGEEAIGVSPEDAVILFSILEIVASIAMIVLITFVGRALGGQGSFDGALTIVVWLQFVMLVISLVQLVALVVLPPIIPVFNLLAIGLFFWLLSGFVAELHGFASAGRVFVVVILGVFLIFNLLSSLILGLGLMPQ